jgi:hypothetical protein
VAATGCARFAEVPELFVSEAASNAFDEWKNVVDSKALRRCKYILLIP